MFPPSLEDGTSMDRIDRIGKRQPMRGARVGEAAWVQTQKFHSRGSRLACRVRVPCSDNHRPRMLHIRVPHSRGESLHRAVERRRKRGNSQSTDAREGMLSRAIAASIRSWRQTVPDTPIRYNRSLRGRPRVIVKGINVSVFQQRRDGSATSSVFTKEQR